LIVPAIMLVILGTGCSSNKKNDDTVNEVKTFAVKTQIIKPDTFVHYFQATGNVLAMESAFISPQANGQIIKLYVSDGDRVSQGQLLVELNASIIKSSISELETQLALAEITFQKQKKLWDQKIGSEIQYLQTKTQKEALEKKLKTLNDQLALTKVTAPFSGIIENIQVNEGELAAPGRQLFELVNLHQMKILADVSESYLPKIHKGDKINISFPDYPEKEISASIYRIGNVINPSNRTFKVEVRFPNPKEEIKPNMVAQLTVKDFESDTAFIVPSIIIKKDFEKDFLFLAKPDGNKWVAEKQFVKSGIPYRDKTMITNGLKTGDIVIIEGYNQIATGSELKLVK
ncbi:MAG: efflux RND transporter periplasmic adaptor subunit, partial [Bacteroidales bacterium]|nr:efflux RND transporter periplasmic adaptor subunit [Bacteroidales bacterium]